MDFSHIDARLARLREGMEREKIDVFFILVTERYNSESLAWLSGFRGSSGAAVVSRSEAWLVTDGRYLLQAKKESPFELVNQGSASLPEKTGEILRSRSWSAGGYEGDRLSVNLFSAVRPALPEWRDCSPLLPSLRRKKDPLEAEYIRRAGIIASDAYHEVLQSVREGMTEKEFNALLEYTLRRMGAEGGWKGSGFIVASGERSALPHGFPTERPFRRGDMVTVDFGATVEGYMSDLTRNFSLGPLSARGAEIEALLLEAHHQAARALRPGATGVEVDAVARKIITDGGWGKQFSHGLGHGLGLEVHEAPRLSPLSTDVLAEGDVVTVEPGIYLEGWGGMRIEDDYLITADGSVCLSGGKGQKTAIL
ncbi:Xaa-Pro peptidase family protein [Aminivibrio sp.]